MKQIGLLSDTHSFVHPKIIEFFKNCDEVWHAGDIGNINVAAQFNKDKTFTHRINFGMIPRDGEIIDQDVVVVATADGQ